MKLAVFYVDVKGLPEATAKSYVDTIAQLYQEKTGGTKVMVIGTQGLNDVKVIDID